MADTRLGYPFRGAVPELTGGSIRVVQTKDVTPEGLKNRDGLLVTELEVGKEPHWLHDQDLLFVARGASNYAVLIENPPPRTICSPHLYVMRVKQPRRLLPAFLAWQLNQPPAQRYLRQAAEGSRQLSIRRSLLDEIEIRIPPIEQQRLVIELERIAKAERDVFQALIRNRETELATLAERLLGHHHGTAA